MSTNRLLLALVALGLTMVLAGVYGFASADQGTGGPSRPDGSGPPPQLTPQPTPASRPAFAPIERAEVRVLESQPPQYVLQVVAGLPSGCAKPGGHFVNRGGGAINVKVLNSVATGGVCTMIYGTYELNIALGSDFEPGVTYAVRVNDRELAFRAQ